MIIVEQKHHKEPEWQSNKHPFNIKIPEVDHPVSGLRWLEGTHNRHAIQSRALKASGKVREANPKKGREDKGIVSENASHTRCPKRAAAELLEPIYRAEV